LKRALWALSVLASAGCGPVYDCTDEVRVSVSVEVVNAEGEDIFDALVDYDAGEGLEPCQSWDGVHACGFEDAGEIDIIVSAPGFEEKLVTVLIRHDDCHVITEDLLIELVEEAP
jgi:hypothetical protein